MSILGRYVHQTVGSAMLIALFLIVGLDVISGIMDQLDDLQGDYSYWQALLYVLMTIPGRVHEYIPISVLIGCLAGMGILGSSSEITVMRASGISLARLMAWSIRPVIGMVILSLLISEFVSPLTDRWAKTHRDIKLWGEAHSQVSAGGLWHKEDNTYMHINVVQPGGVLLGLTVFYFDEQQNLLRAQSARRATFVGAKWLLEDIVETTLQTGSTSSQRLATAQWQTRLTPESLALLASEPEEMSPSELWQYSDYLRQNNLDNEPYRLSFWQKAFQPLAIFSLVVIALSFVFGPLRSTTMGFRVFIGVIVGIAFQFAQNLLGPASLIYGFSPVLAVLTPIGICALVGLVLLYRVS